MKSALRILLSVFILSVVKEIKPAPFDTGMITLTQPNDVTFTGRIWGDEFIWWAETEDGAIIFECTVNALTEIAAWIVARGEGVKVLQPEELKLQVIELAKGTLKNY